MTFLRSFGRSVYTISSLDSYPQGFDCSHPEVWNPVTTNYHSYHEQVKCVLFFPSLPAAIGADISLSALRKHGTSLVTSPLSIRALFSTLTSLKTEFQGGSFDAWGPTAPGTSCHYSRQKLLTESLRSGYGPCAELTGPNFQSVFNKQLWASNAKLISYYMIYG